MVKEGIKAFSLPTVMPYLFGIIRFLSEPGHKKGVATGSFLSTTTKLGWAGGHKAMGRQGMSGITI